MGRTQPVADKAKGAVLSGEAEIGICPRCGSELVRSSTPTGKVCFRCPSCGGVAVTLPVLRESLDARSIAVLVQAARAAERAGCTCPGCGGRMSLLKVGDGKDKLEIDVCGRCLSVWCDKGEYETLAPPPKSRERSMRELLEQASPETHERYADALLESLPEEVSPADFDIGDILRDIARLVIGAPTLWRDVRPVTPLFTILLTLALPIVQACTYYRFHDLQTIGGYTIRFHSSYRDFWYLSASMAEKCGFALSAPLNALSFPFVQTSGRMALTCAFLLFLPLAAIERRVGHARFIVLFFTFTAASAIAHALFAAMGLATGYLCGIAPVGLGFLVYCSSAWPDLHIKGSLGLMSIYSGIVGLFLLLFPLLNASVLNFLSCGLGSIAACLTLGAILGSRARKRICV